MAEMNRTIPCRKYLGTGHWLAALAVAACGLSMPSSAGQAGSTFRVSVDLIPAGANSCTAVLDAGGKPAVSCAPRVVSVGAAGSSGSGTQTGGSREPTIGYRSRELGFKLSGIVTEEGESFYALGEYSSRMVSAGNIEYVEMTVTW